MWTYFSVTKKVGKNKTKSTTTPSKKPSEEYVGKVIPLFGSEPKPSIANGSSCLECRSHLPKGPETPLPRGLS